MESPSYAYSFLEGQVRAVLPKLPSIDLSSSDPSRHTGPLCSAFHHKVVLLCIACDATVRIRLKRHIDKFNFLTHMKTRKKLLLGTLFMLFFVVNVYGETQRSVPHEGTLGLEGIKFGCKLKYQHAALLCLDAKNNKESLPEVLFRPSFDLFGEYLLSNVVGVQLSLGYSGQGGETKKDNGGGDPSEIYLNYMMLSAVVRCYPGSSRQFCFFVGYWAGRLASAKSRVLVDGQKKGRESNLLLGSSTDELRCRRTNQGVLLGVDYEFNPGVVLGFYYNLGGTAFNQSQRTKLLNLSCGVDIGYNFAKLF